jgi:hypothetical protein
MKEIMCFLGFHKWGKWDEPTFHQFVYAKGLFSNDLYASYFSYRACKKCGRFQEKEVTEREIQAKKDYELCTFWLKKSKYYSEIKDWDKASMWLKMAESIYNS